MIIPAVVAVAIPLIFLYLVRWLDLYASGSLKMILICLVWGAVTFFIALYLNTYIAGIIGFTWLTILAAPILEEFLKSVVLLYLVRRPSFTYFVDGAIYGFAAGTAFAMLENLLYLSRSGTGEAIFLALGRAFSTSLMHGSACALVGIALGRFRYGRGSTRVLSMISGWAGAMVLHLAFNNSLNYFSDLTGVIAAVLLGLTGAGMVTAFILWGLREERHWMKETLVLSAGVSARESAVVQQMADLDILLEPIAERFGREKRQHVESFLKLQAQLGIKRKILAMTRSEAEHVEIEKQVLDMQQEMDILRRRVGVYCMAYLRLILPPQTEPIWSRLNRSLTDTDTEKSKGLWNKLGERFREEMPPR